MSGKRPPTMYDIANSQNFGRVADHVMIAWRPDLKKNETFLDIAKSKTHHITGMPGDMWIGLDEGRFEIRPLGYNPIQQKIESKKFDREAKKQKLAIEKASTGGKSNVVNF